MVRQQTISAFVGLPGVVGTRKQVIGPQQNVFTRRPVHVRVQRHARSYSRPHMSLTSELLFKVIEVGAATAVGNTVASTQEKRKPNSPFFNLGKKKRRVKGAVNIDSRMNDAVAEVLKIADNLPELIEKGGPEGRRWVKLAICIVIDLVGSGSLGVPFLGDVLDVVTAPVSAAMLQALFGSTLVTVGGFMEEILPGTDGIPTATLAWLAENYGYFKSRQDEEVGGLKN